MSIKVYSRRQLMAAFRPYDAEIEYLESDTRFPYIDTLLFYFADFEIGVKLRINEPNVVLGMDDRYNLARTSSSQPYWQFVAENRYYTNIPILQYHVLKWVDDKIFCDGVYLSDFAKTRANFSQSMKLFGVDGRIRPNIIYYCKLYSPTTHLIVRDYIPVRVGTTGYMYDKVSGKLFGNAGTGDFVLGPDVAHRPYDAEIEYLQGDGASYIMTDFTPSDTSRVVVKVKDYRTTGRWIFGTRVAFANRAFGFYSNNSLVSFASQFGSNYVEIGNYDMSNSGIVTIDYNGVIKTCTITSEYGSVLSKAIGNATFTAPAPLVLFGLNFNGESVGSFSEVKLYTASIYSNGSLVHNFIPVRVGNVGYLFDRVSGQLFGNSGAGSFILGPDK